jgi:hypothetical protein
VKHPSPQARAKKEMLVVSMLPYRALKIENRFVYISKSRTLLRNVLSERVPIHGEGSRIWQIPGTCGTRHVLAARPKLRDIHLRRSSLSSGWSRTCTAVPIALQVRVASLKICENLYSVTVTLYLESTAFSCKKFCYVIFFPADTDTGTCTCTYVRPKSVHFSRVIKYQGLQAFQPPIYFEKKKNP